MAISKLFGLYGVQIDTATGANEFLSGMQSIRLALNNGKTRNSGDGFVDDSFVALMTQAPRITMITTDVKRALDLIGIAGLKIDSDGGSDGVEIWWEQVDEGGIRKAGAVHMKLTVNEGLMVIRRISVNHTGVMQAEIELVTTHDGTNDPIVAAENQLLEGTRLIDEQFTLGPVNINATRIEGIQNLEIDFGIQERARGGDGEVFPTFVYIPFRQFVINWGTTDPTVLVSLIGTTGAKQLAADSEFYFRKLDEGGTRVAEAVAEHIKVTMGKGRHDISEQTTEHKSETATTGVSVPSSDAGAAPVVISTASAIT